MEVVEESYALVLVNRAPGIHLTSLQTMVEGIPGDQALGMYLHRPANWTMQGDYDRDETYVRLLKQEAMAGHGSIVKPAFEEPAEVALLGSFEPVMPFSEVTGAALLSQEPPALGCPADAICRPERGDLSSDAERGSPEVRPCWRAHCSIASAGRADSRRHRPLQRALLAGA